MHNFSTDTNTYTEWRGVRGGRSQRSRQLLLVHGQSRIEARGQGTKTVHPGDNGTTTIPARSSKLEDSQAPSSTTSSGTTVLIRAGAVDNYAQLRTKLIETYWNGLKLIETEWNCLKLIETDGDWLELIETDWQLIETWN